MRDIKQDTILLPVYSPNADRFLKFFHCRLTGEFAIKALCEIKDRVQKIAMLKD